MIQSFLRLWPRGVAMGVADLIPGVSGGTMALITGIYGPLLEALDSLRHIKTPSRVHFSFLIFLFSGILCAVFFLAPVVHHLMSQWPVPTYAFFFGLVLASALALGKNLPPGNLPLKGTAVVGAGLLCYLAVGMIPWNTPKHLGFIYLCGLVGAMAMILPGISGSFVLLILGQYHTLLGAVKAPMSDGHGALLGAFGLGVITGLTLFARALKLLLARYHMATMSILVGILLGSLRKLWPWGGPHPTPGPQGTLLAIGTLGIGMGLVFLLGRQALRERP